MLKILGNKLAEARKYVVQVSDDRKKHSDNVKLVSRNEINDYEIRDNEIRKNQKMSKSKKIIGSDFFTFRARLVFTELKQAFVKAPILHHFDLEYFFQVEIDASGYTISKVFSQLTLDNLGQ